MAEQPSQEDGSTTIVMETQLSQESTNNEEDGSKERVIAIACNTALDKKCATRIPEPNRRLLQPFRLQYFYCRASC